MQHDVYQLVYTKVPPGESPWNIMDFHTVFYPVDVISGGDVNDIEKMIHKPQVDGFKEKFTVFFKEISGKDYLAVLYTIDLPDDRDVFGRGGLFLCHGFLFPPELWMEAQTPISLFDLVEDHVFTGLEVLLDSEMVDKSKGSIRPICIGNYSPSKVDWPPLSDRFKLKMVFYLFKAARGYHELPNLILYGCSDDVSGLLDELFFYIPDELKVNLGWDSAFDGGTLYNYPLKVVGFNEERPYGGEQILVDLSTGKIDHPSALNHLFHPESAYEKWLESCNETLSKKDIEAAYRLSLLLEGEEEVPIGDSMPVLRSFAQVNRGLVESLFSEKFLDTFGLEVCGVSPEVMLEFIIEGVHSTSIVKTVESLVIDNSLIDEEINLPTEITSRSKILDIIQRIWYGLDVSDDFGALEAEEQCDIIIYLIKTGLLLNYDVWDDFEGNDLLRDWIDLIEVFSKTDNSPEVNSEDYTTHGEVTENDGGEFIYSSEKSGGPFEKIRGLLEIFLSLFR